MLRALLRARFHFAGSASLTWMTTRFFCAAPGWPCALAAPALKHNAEASNAAASNVLAVSNGASLQYTGTGATDLTAEATGARFITERSDLQVCKATYERLRPSTAQQVLRFHRMQQTTAPASA